MVRLGQPRVRVRVTYAWLYTYHVIQSACDLHKTCASPRFIYCSSSLQVIVESSFNHHTEGRDSYFFKNLVQFT